MPPGRKTNDFAGCSLIFHKTDARKRFRGKVTIAFRRDDDNIPETESHAQRRGREQAVPEH